MGCDGGPCGARCSGCGGIDSERPACAEVNGHMLNAVDDHFLVSGFVVARSCSYSDTTDPHGARAVLDTRMKKPDRNAG